MTNSLPDKTVIDKIPSLLKESETLSDSLRAWHDEMVSIGCVDLTDGYCMECGDVSLVLWNDINVLCHVTCHFLSKESSRLQPELYEGLSSPFINVVNGTIHLWINLYSIDYHLMSSFNPCRIVRNIERLCR